MILRKKIKELFYYEKTKTKHFFRQFEKSGKS